MQGKNRQPKLKTNKFTLHSEHNLHNPITLQQFKIYNNTRVSKLTIPFKSSTLVIFNNHGRLALNIQEQIF